MGDPNVGVYGGVGNANGSSRCDTTSRCKTELSTLTGLPRAGGGVSVPERVSVVVS